MASPSKNNDGLEMPVKTSEPWASGHRRSASASMGKAMPVTSLLMNYQPPTMAMMRAQEMREDDRPPIYFPVDDALPAEQQPPAAYRKSLSEADDTNCIDYDVLVSECSSNTGDGGDEPHPEECQALLGDRRKTAPSCLRCTRAAPDDLTSRESAINEMCRRLCTDECRLRLTLAGFEPPTETALRSWQMAIGVESPVAAATALPTIAIQRKKFLSDLLGDDNTSSASDDAIDRYQPPPDAVNAISDAETTTTIVVKDGGDREKHEIAEALAKTSAMTSTSRMKQRLAARKLEIDFDNHRDDATTMETMETKAVNATINDDDNIITEHEGAAQTTAKLATTTTGVTGVGVVNADAPMTPTTTTTIHPSTVNLENIADSVAAAKQSGSEFTPPRDLLMYLVSEFMTEFNKQIRQFHTLYVIGMLVGNHLLKSFVTMGSFNSAPKINNIDSQDDDLEIPKDLSATELLHHVKHLRGDGQPPLLTRYFLKPSLDTQMFGNDIAETLRSLKLNSVTRGCSSPVVSSNRVRLLQWNILSQTLGQNNDGFVCCPEEALTWDNRKFLIVQEILQNNPDVVCLQEVDHFKFLQTILGTQNYEGIFFPKPDSPCLYIEENNGPDGCAIFYRRDKFELKDYSTRILEVWRVQSNQVAIAANLLHKSTGEEICVCTTHLKARHGSLLSKLRNEQGRDLIRFVKKFAENRPVLLCGDFNAEPIEPVYRTILNCDLMELSSAYADIRMESGECNDDNSNCSNGNGKCHEASQGSDNEIVDKVQLSIEREPPYTTWKIRENGEECHTIDYVFYTKEKLKIKNCLEFPHGNEIGKNRTPSFQYPSDHFSLVCDFEIINGDDDDKTDIVKTIPSLATDDTP